MRFLRLLPPTLLALAGVIVVNSLPKSDRAFNSPMQHSERTSTDPSRFLEVFPKDRSPETLLQNILTSSHPNERHAELSHLLPLLVISDASAAGRFAMGMEPGDLREESMRMVAQNWGATDPEAAITWAGSLVDETERNTALKAICLGRAIVFPKEAIRMAVELKLENDDLLQSLTQQWASKDISEALAWVKQQAQGERRDELIQQVAGVQAKTDPEAAGRLIIDQIPPGPAQTEAIITVVYQWAQTDPTRAARWVARFPDSAIKVRALGEIPRIVSR